MTQTTYTAIGLMSGTSLDGVDAALLRTDGENFVEQVGATSLPYDPDMRDFLRACLNKSEDTDGSIAKTEREMTLFHADVVRELLADYETSAEQIDVIGFHGQTVFHDPDNHFTWQIGDGALLAKELGIDVVNDFRSHDVKAGGQGAPLLPVYHRVRAAELAKPLAILNLGGVGNVTYIGREANEMIAFDTGPANALVDDFMRKRSRGSFDKNGALAASGSIHEDILSQMLRHSYFAQTPPKSLDRNAWDLEVVRPLSDADGAATLSAFTAWSVAKAQNFFPEPPEQWIVTGGGRNNDYIMKLLRDVLDGPVKPVETVGWNGDTVEAEGFAYMAVRALLDLPITFPGTTGVEAPMSGGILHKA